MRRLLSYIGVAILVASIFAVPAYAVVKSNDTIVVRADEVIDDDFFAAGDEVTIEGTINGDVYVVASRLNVRGTVNGDVLAGATTIEVTGTIRDDLRAGGNTISLVGATIGDSVSIAGNELSIDGDSAIGGALIFGGRLLTLDGSVGRGATIGSETTRLDGEIGATVRVAATTVTIDDDAVINGDLEYRSEDAATIRGEVTGDVIRGEGGGVNLELQSVMQWFALGANIWAFVSAAIIGALLVFLMPKLLPTSYARFVKKPQRSSGFGALVLFATLPAVFILILTVFGIPLALIILTLWVLALYFAKFFAGYAAGVSLLRWMNNREDYQPRTYSALLLGLVLYYTLRMWPVIGVPIRFAATIVGLGMMLALYQRKMSSRKKESST